MEKVKYTSLNNYLRELFGCKVYKISLDGGFTCPNRDGTLGTKGCIFCSKGGSGDFSSDRNKSIKDQLKQAKEKVSAKLPKTEDIKYIAYFQAFTNTYGPIPELREKYLEAISDEEVVAISIATRPDCLSLEVIKLLSEINKIKKVFVELGLQTIHEETAKYIRRGYDLSVYDFAVKELLLHNIEVVTHVIIGLPGESKEMMLDTVRYVVNSGAKGIKLQLLHILKETDLYNDYKEGLVNVLSLEEYVNICVEALKLLPKDMVVHRITGDGDKKILAAPLWSQNKKKVLNTFKEHIEPY